MSDYFDNYFFTSNQTDHVCPDFGTFQCQPPNACARDPNTGKRYCCDYGDVCWTIPSNCGNDGSTFNCGDGQNAWCCLEKTEVCTGSVGQINICWSSAHNTLVNISTSVLNKTYSSLSAASPSASSFVFDPAALIAATRTSSKTTSTSGLSLSTTTTSSSESATTPSSSESSTTPSSPPTAGSSTSISGGAIGGIVVGAVAFTALLALGVYFLKRRYKRNYAPALKAPAYEADKRAESQSQTPAGLARSPYELSAGPPASELHGDWGNLSPQELPTNSLNSPHPYR